MGSGDQRERYLGEFRLGAEIGRGGMGVVFEATQKSLGRRVAVKVLPAHISMSSDALVRFRREAVTASRLNHPGIAKVYSVGASDGLHYFAMELVEGPSLDRCLDEVRGRPVHELQRPLLEEAGFEPGEFVPPSPHLPYFAAVAAWGAEIADALAAAHRERVLHRDVKPSNILLRRDGSPVLVDFGLAQDSLSTNLTKTGDAVGTPAYMAPEQARGMKGLDGRVDVYGLGATLYELITLCPPFDGPHPVQVMKRILTEDVVDPCRINRSCPRDLANIILKCLAKERDERYRDARELARDLRSFLRGDPVAARPPTTGQRIKRTLVRRRRGVAVSVLTALGVLIAGAGAVGLKGSFDRSAARGSLQSALDALAAGEEFEAVQSFLEAREVLGDEVVKAPWLGFLRRKTELLIAGEKFARAERLLVACAQMYMNDPTVRGLYEEARGTGNVSVTVDPPDARVSLVPLDDEGRPVEGARPHSATGQLLAGTYRVEVQAGPSFVPAVTVVRVERNGDLALTLRALPRSELPPNTVFVAGAGDGSLPAFLIDRTEVTNREYAAFVASLPPGRRAEFVPPELWPDGTPPADLLDQPVRYVSFAAARAFARWKGGHLPMIDEFRWTGNAGAPWSFPWGPRFEPAKVAAGPELSAPLDAGSRADGGSPGGALDLVGNVAEWVVDVDGTPLAAGGSFASAEESLRLDAARAVPSGAGAREIGFRVAYYPRPPDRPEAASRIDGAWRSRLRLGQPQRRTTVRIGDGGRIDIRIEVAGRLGARVPPYFRLPGGRSFFAPAAEPEVESSEGMRLSVLKAGVSEQRVKPLFSDAPRGQRFRFGIDWEDVRPKQVFVALPGGRFRHRFIAFDNPEEVHFHRVHLPGRARILRASPPPADRVASGGEQVVSIEIPARGEGDPRVVPIEIEFVMDCRDAPLPPLADVAGIVRRFCRSWNRGVTAGGLLDVTADRFTFGASSMQRYELGVVLRRAARVSDETLRAAVADARVLMPEDPRIASLSGSGRTLRVEVDAGDGHWVFVLERARDGLRVLELQRPLRADGCVQTVAGLQHPDLQITVPRRPDYRFERLARFTTPLQVRLERVRPILVGRSPESSHRVTFRVLLLATRVPEGRNTDALAEQLIAEAFPLYTAVEPTTEQRTSRVGLYEVPARLVFLTRPWVPEQAEPRLLQERIVFQRGRTLLVILGTIEADSAVPAKLQQAWTKLLVNELDEITKSIRVGR